MNESARVLAEEAAHRAAMSEAKAESDLGLSDDGELVAGFVDIRGQDLEARLLCAGNVKLPRLVDVLDDVVRVADLR